MNLSILWIFLLASSPTRALTAFERLQDPIMSDDVDALITVFQEHFNGNYNIVNETGWTPLHIAAAYGSRQVIGLLLHSGANETATTFDTNEMPIHVATWHHQSDVVRLFLEHAGHSDLRQKMIGAVDREGRAPICIAGQIGNVMIARYLMHAVDRPQKEAIFDETPCPFGIPKRIGNVLHVAVIYNQASFVEFLLTNARRQLITAVDSAGSTPLHIAAFRQDQMFKKHEPTVSYPILHDSMPPPEGLGIDVPNPLVISLFMGAIQDSPGDTIATALLQHGADLEAQDGEGRTPFLTAILNGAVIYAKFLHSKGANVSAVDPHGYNAFHIASDTKTLAYLMELKIRKQLTHGLDEQTNPCVDCTVPGNLTPLQVAILEGKNLDVVKFFVDQDANIAVTNDKGDTAIHMAVKANYSDALSLLLEKPSSRGLLSLSDSLGKKPMQVAVELGSLDMARMLLSALRHPNDTLNDMLELLSDSHPTALREAVVRKNYQAFKMVLQGDDEEEDGSRISRLHDAIARDELSHVKEMFSALFHDEFNIQNETGWAPLHVASFYSAEQVANFLIMHGAKLDIHTENGETPLHIAVWSNSVRVLQLLLDEISQLSSDDQLRIIESQDKDGKTAIFYANFEFPYVATDNKMTEWKEYAAAEVLLAHGADIGHMDAFGMRPIHDAIASDNRPFAEFLVEQGASLLSRCCQPAGKTAIHVAAEFDSSKVFQGPLFQLLNETVYDNFDNAPICIAANVGSVNFARKLFEATKRNGVIDQLNQPCFYPPIFKVSDSGEPVHIAVSSDQPAFVDFLMEFGTDEVLQSVDSSGRSLLHVAAFRVNNSKVVDYLISHGSYLEDKDDKDRTPFLFAVERGHVKYADYLQKSGADVDAVDTKGYTAFHIASSNEMITYLLELHFTGGMTHSINSRSYLCRELPSPSVKCMQMGGLTPLHVAIMESKRPSFIQHLIRHNADLTLTTDFSQTAFHLAVQSSQLETLATMLTHIDDTDVLSVRDGSGETALDIAIRTNNAGAMNALLALDFDDKKSNVTEMLSGDGLTALHKAIFDRNVEAVKLLLEHGSSALTFDAFGRSALRFAVDLNDAEERDVFKIILQQAVNESALDIQDAFYGDTALHVVVKQQRSVLATMLLNDGASCSVTNNDGHTPLHIAVANGFGDMAQRLIKFESCNPLYVVDSHGNTILESKLLQTYAQPFVEEMLMRPTTNCGVLARKIQIAIRMGSLNFADILLKSMGDAACQKPAPALDFINPDGLSVFHTAIILGDVNAVNWCIQHGATVTRKTGKGRSVMTIGLFGNYTEEVVAFVDSLTDSLVDSKKACVSVKNEFKTVAKRRMDIVRILIAKDALLTQNMIDDSNGNSPLHFLAAIGDVETGTEIVANGRVSVDTNVINRHGLAPLHIAVLSNGRDAVDFTELLLDYSADVSMPSTLVTDEGDSGLLPLHVAASRCGNGDTLDSLIYYVIHQFERNSAVQFLTRVSTKLGRTAGYLSSKYHRIDLHLRMLEVFEYFRSWSKAPFRTLPTLPNIRALLPLPNGKQVVAVYHDGDVLGVSTDCESTLWRSKVLPPKDFLGKFEGIYHAALDTITHFVYFTFQHPVREAGIFYTTLRKLTQQPEVILEKLLRNSTKDSQFLALYVDAERETILANDPWMNHNIGAYSLSDGAFLNESTVDSPNVVEKFEPLFCALSRPSPPVANTDSGPRLLAVSDYTHRVHVFTRRPHGRDGFITNFVSTIATEDPTNPSKLGAVFYPADLTFDHLGNLFVADYLNRRLQIFAAADLNDATSLRAVWATDKLRSEVQRVAVSVSKHFIPTVFVGLENGQILCYRQSHKL